MKGGYYPQCENRWNERLYDEMLHRSISPYTQVCPKQRKEKQICEKCPNRKWKREGGWLNRDYKGKEAVYVYDYIDSLMRYFDRM